MALVEFDGVGFEIAGRLILRDFHLRVEQGETLVLLGRSGSGKSTALKLVNGLLAPTAGRVLVDGKPTGDWDPVRLKRSIGYAIQDTGLFPHYTVARNIALVPSLDGAVNLDSRVDELLSLTGLDPATFRHRYPAQLSGGQKQRVGVARALAARPRLLLFDEPFGALDPVTRNDMQRLFQKVREGITALFVTHDIREALRVGDRIALLHHGRVDTLAPARDFHAAESTEAKAFLECL